jgi:hypothetical protein
MVDRGMMFGGPPAAGVSDREARWAAKARSRGAAPAPSAAPNVPAPFATPAGEGFPFAAAPEGSLADALRAGGGAAGASFRASFPAFGDFPLAAVAPPPPLAQPHQPPPFTASPDPFKAPAAFGGWDAPGEEVASDPQPPAPPLPPPPPPPSAAAARAAYGAELQAQAEQSRAARVQNAERERAEVKASHGLLPSSSFLPPQPQPPPRAVPPLADLNRDLVAPLGSPAGAHTANFLPRRARADAAASATYAEELEAQVREKEAASRRRRDAERATAQASAGISDLIAASGNHARAIAGHTARGGVGSAALAPALPTAVGGWGSAAPAAGLPAPSPPAGRPGPYQQQQQQQQQRSWHSGEAPAGGAFPPALAADPFSSLERSAASRSPVALEAEARRRAEAEARARVDAEERARAELDAKAAKLSYGAELEAQMQAREVAKLQERAARMAVQPVKGGVNALPTLSTAAAGGRRAQNPRVAALDAARAAAAAAYADAAAVHRAAAPQHYVLHGGHAPPPHHQQQQQHFAPPVDPYPLPPPLPPYHEPLPLAYASYPAQYAPPPPHSGDPAPPHAPPYAAQRGDAPAAFLGGGAPGEAEAEAARRRTAYGAELERQANDNRARKEAAKREAAAEEARLERSNLLHARVMMGRKALGGAGEPLRDADGRVVAQLRGMSPPPAQAPVPLPPRLGGEGAGGWPPVSVEGGPWAEERGGGGGGGAPFAPQSPPRDGSVGGGGSGRGSLKDLMAGLSPDQAARRARQREETARALAAQIAEREASKAEAAAKRAAQEAEEEARLARERSELAEAYAREETKRREKEENERRAALEEQIAAKARAAAASEALEKEAEERAETKLAKQRRELAEQFAKERGEGAGAPPGAVGGTPAAQEPAPPASVAGGARPPGGGGSPTHAAKAARDHLFGPASPPPFPGEPSLADVLGGRGGAVGAPHYAPLPPPPAYADAYGALFPGGAGEPQQHYAPAPAFGYPPQAPTVPWAPAPPPLPPQAPPHPFLAPPPPIMDPALPKRLVQAEGELERLRTALTALQLQQSDAAFVAGLERMGLSRDTAAGGMPPALAAAMAASLHGRGGARGGVQRTAAAVAAEEEEDAHARLAALLGDVPGLVLPGAASSQRPLGTADSRRSGGGVDALGSSLPGRSALQGGGARALQPLTVGGVRGGGGGGGGGWTPAEADAAGVDVADPMLAFPELQALLASERDELSGGSERRAPPRSHSAQSIRGESRLLPPAAGGLFSPSDAASPPPFPPQPPPPPPPPRAPPPLPTVPEGGGAGDDTASYLEASADSDALGNSFMGIDRALAARDGNFVAPWAGGGDGFDGGGGGSSVFAGAGRATLEGAAPGPQRESSSRGSASTHGTHVLAEIDAILRGAPPVGSRPPPAAREAARPAVAPARAPVGAPPLPPAAYLGAGGAGVDGLDRFADGLAPLQTGGGGAPRRALPLHPAVAPADAATPHGGGGGGGGARGPQRPLSAASGASTDAALLAAENGARVKKLAALGLIDEIEAAELEESVDASAMLRARAAPRARGALDGRGALPEGIASLPARRYAGVGLRRPESRASEASASSETPLEVHPSERYAAGLRAAAAGGGGGAEKPRWRRREEGEGAHARAREGAARQLPPRSGQQQRPWREEDEEAGGSVEEDDEEEEEEDAIAGRWGGGRRSEAASPPFRRDDSRRGGQRSGGWSPRERSREWWERDARERELRERDARERELRERDARERERDARERELRERDARERERDARERELRERDARERERDARERELRERDARDRERGAPSWARGGGEEAWRRPAHGAAGGRSGDPSGRPRRRDEDWGAPREQPRWRGDDEGRSPSPLLPPHHAQRRARSSRPPRGEREEDWRGGGGGGGAARRGRSVEDRGPARLGGVRGDDAHPVNDLSGSSAGASGYAPIVMQVGTPEQGRRGGGGARASRLGGKTELLPY